MTRSRLAKLTGLLLTGAWLPVTISCQPEGWGGIVRWAGDWIEEHVVVEEVYEPWYGYECCGYPGWGGLHVNIEYDD